MSDERALLDMVAQSGSLEDAVKKFKRPAATVLKKANMLGIEFPSSTPKRKRPRASA